MPNQLVCTAPNMIEIQRYEDVPVGPTQVKVKTLIGTLKHGTQFRAIRRDTLDYKKPFDKELRLHNNEAQKPDDNYLLGDAILGKVIETGSECKRLKVGDTVYGLHRLKETHVVDESTLSVNNFPGEEGLLFDPALTGLGAVREGNIRIGDRVVFMGLGAINLLGIEFAKLQQARQIIAFDPHEMKRKEAERRGVKAFDPYVADPGKTVRELTGGKGADVVVEASSSYKGLADAVRCAAYKGTVISISYYTGSEVGFQLAGEWLRNSITVKAFNPVSPPYADAPRWDMDRLIDTSRNLFEKGLVDTKGIINPVVSLNEAPQRIAEALQNSGSFIKIGIRFSE